MDTNIKISIVVPTYNHCDDLLKPLCKSVIENTSLDNIEIIIVANGCTDHTEEYVKSLGSPFKIISIDHPCGYTKATNIGILAAEGEYVLLLNNDCVILPHKKDDWINMMMEPFKSDEKTGVTGPFKSFMKKGIDRHFMVFFCVMIKKKLFEEIGLLDIIFNPGAGEDTDFCIKAEDAGYKLMQVPPDPLGQSDNLTTGNFPIYHAGGKTVSAYPNWDDTFKRNDQYLRNRYGKASMTGS